MQERRKKKKKRMEKNYLYALISIKHENPNNKNIKK